MLTTPSIAEGAIAASRRWQVYGSAQRKVSGDDVDEFGRNSRGDFGMILDRMITYLENWLLIKEILLLCQRARWKL